MSWVNSGKDPPVLWDVIGAHAVVDVTAAICAIKQVDQLYANDWQSSTAGNITVSL